jgi:hypothetical protein
MKSMIISNASKKSARIIHDKALQWLDRQKKAAYRDKQ